MGIKEIGQRCAVSAIATAACFTLFMNLPSAKNVVNADSGVAINADNFPDENFRSYVSDRFDKDHNSYLSDTEISKATSIYVSNKNISNIKGVEFFTALKDLICDSNKLTSLDISKNTKLQMLNCSNNQIASLDVRNNTELTSLNCAENCLTSLDLSKNTNLTYLRCTNNQLTNLDISKCTSLGEIYCYWNQLASLDVRNNTELTELDCRTNCLTSLDLSKNTALKTLLPKQSVD